VAIAVADQKEWQALCKLMRNPDWAQKEDFSDELSRWKNQENLDMYLGQWTRQFGSYEVTSMLQKAGIAAAPSFSTKQLTHDKHLEEREFFIRTQHAVLGNVLLTGLPFRVSDTPKGNYRVAPLLGEHNEYVFGQLLGLSSEEMKQLADEQVFA